MSKRLIPILTAMALLSCAAPNLHAGGPRQVAGSTYFDPAVMGTPVHWAGGQVNYFVDRGALSATVDNQQATAMVDAAAALWGGVPTAALALKNSGTLNEDVSAANAVPAAGTLLQPADVAARATAYPLAVIFDYDGSVMDGVLGIYTSEPGNCQNNAVRIWVDNQRTDATIAHAVLILNGRCTDTSDRIAMMKFLLARGFGLVLGLGHSQYAPHALDSYSTSGQAHGWPIMQAAAGVCGFDGGINCIPEPDQLHWDDIASLNRLYPVTTDNLSRFPGKMLTAANTISIKGTVSFRGGTGMQGVNVTAQPLDERGNPMAEYGFTYVSGSLFRGWTGTAITTLNDDSGVPLSQYGSTDPALQGAFDLSGIPLPSGMTQAAFLITFEQVDPLFTYDRAVGPYIPGSPLPSGTLKPFTTSVISAGGSQAVQIQVQDSAVGDYNSAISTEESPRMLSPSGFWCGRLAQVGQTDWLEFPVRGNRTFTVITEALDETGRPSNFKAMPVVSLWDAFRPLGSAPAATSPGLNGSSVGETWVRAESSGDDTVRLGIADLRGDGRPDYAYDGWVLYADSVEPQRIPIGGGPIVIRGMGFHSVDTVLVGGVKAQVTSVSPTQITAIAPAAPSGTTGSVDVEVDDAPIYYAQAIMTGALSYDTGTADSLTMISAPANSVPMNVPIPFAVRALGPDLQPAPGVTITYTVTSGSASLGCGGITCTVTAGGDGAASVDVIAMDTTPSVVVASLVNGTSLQAHFNGGTAPTIAALNPSLSVAAGTSVNWTTQALVLSNGVPSCDQSVMWKPGSGMTASGTAAKSSPAGIATQQFAVGPLIAGQQAVATACVNGTSQCTAFAANAARPEYAYLESVSGDNQSVAAYASPAAVVFRVRDMNGNPMAGGVVTFYQAVYAWAPPCPSHGRCAQAQLLATQVGTAISGLEGVVTFIPAGIPGIATNVLGIAATGNTSMLSASLEVHP